MVTKKKKQQLVDILVNQLQEAQGIFLVNFESMDVALTNQFRKLVFEKELKYKVAKNTLLRRALDVVGKFDIPDDVLKGQTAIVFGYSDPTKPAKVIKEFSEKGGKPAFKAAVIEGQFFGSSQLSVVASLPSRDDLMAGIVGSLGAPASGIVGTINSLLSDVASLIEEVAKKQNGAA
jgi:large subunit ribosomal protein L10